MAAMPFDGPLNGYLWRCFVIALATRLGAQTADRPFVVEYYYKAKWGYAEEFIRLFKKPLPSTKERKGVGTYSGA